MKNLENAHLKAMKALKEAKEHSSSISDDVVKEIKETHRKFLNENSDEEVLEEEQKMEKENENDSGSLDKPERYWENLSLFKKIGALIIAIVLVLLVRKWEHLCYVLVWLGFLLYGKCTNIFYKGIDSSKLQNVRLKWSHVVVGYVVFFFSCIFLLLFWEVVGLLFEKRVSESSVNDKESSSIVIFPPKDENVSSDEVEGDTEISEVTYKTYYNSRFGYEIRYPSFFDKITLPSNGDGCQLMRDERTYLSVSGINNVLDETLKECYDRRKVNAVYSRMKGDWFVVSGYTDDGRIYYEKTVLRDGAFLTAILYHPIEEKEYFSPIISEIFTDFPGVK